MPTITTHYGVKGPVPFIDVDVSDDNRLYVDPHAIRLRRSPQPFLKRAVKCMDTFTSEVTKSVITGSPASLRRGKGLLQEFFEPWETRLGMAQQGFQGHGGAEVVGKWIWDVLNNDVEALVRLGILHQLEDLPLFVRGVDRDITSDITTRIIFGPLSDFTEHMIHTFPEFTSNGNRVKTYLKQVWNSVSLEWEDTRVTLPVVGGKPLLLVPLGWARHTLLMSAGRYYETSVLSYAQLERAVRMSDGKLSTTPKDRLRKEPGLGRGRETNMTLTIRALKNEEDLLAAFKAFVSVQLKKEDRDSHDDVA
ncbi:hypothetical protein [Brevibacterium sp. CFH 10365]|uniref:hypothetical protein n=1 Tax=Brevibacterium sp. CFH 10365 TaxID=2585207 RepID=UPI00126684E3|nr:hypothetical protein [Brevibacterium sp. CFH 10365]